MLPHASVGAAVAVNVYLIDAKEALELLKVMTTNAAHMLRCESVHNLVAICKHVLPWQAVASNPGIRSSVSASAGK
jgi:hypothetical protein